MFSASFQAPSIQVVCAPGEETLFQKGKMSVLPDISSVRAVLVEHWGLKPDCGRLRGSDVSIEIKDIDKNSS